MRKKLSILRLPLSHKNAGGNPRLLEADLFRRTTAFIPYSEKLVQLYDIPNNSPIYRVQIEVFPRQTTTFGHISDVRPLLRACSKLPPEID